MLYYTEPQLSTWQLARARRQIVFYDFIVSAMAYGNADRLLRPGIQSSQNTFTIYLKDGCVENGGFYYTMDDCQHNFQNGLLTDGLLAVARDYTASARMVFDARAAELAANPRGPLTSVSFLSGLPYKVNQLGLNYLAAGFHENARQRLTESIGKLESFQ